MIERQIEYRPPRSLKPHPNNVRNHSGEQIRRLAESIKEFGFTNPALIDENEFILAGHARALAAKTLGLAKIPVIVLHGLSDGLKRAYVLADNKIAEMAGYDHPALAVELQNLSELFAKDGLDLSLTGFDPAEIDALLVHLADPEHEPDDELPVITTKCPTQNDYI